MWLNEKEAPPQGKEISTAASVLLFEVKKIANDASKLICRTNLSQNYEAESQGRCCSLQMRLTWVLLLPTSLLSMHSKVQKCSKPLRSTKKCLLIGKKTSKCAARKNRFEANRAMRSGAMPSKQSKMLCLEWFWETEGMLLPEGLRHSWD